MTVQGHPQRAELPMAASGPAELWAAADDQPGLGQEIRQRGGRAPSRRHRTVPIRPTRPGREDRPRAQPRLLGRQGEARPRDLPPACRIRRPASTRWRTTKIQMMTTPPWDEIDRLVGEGFVLTTNKNVPYINFIAPQLQEPRASGHPRAEGDQHGDRPRGHRQGDQARHSPRRIRPALAGHRRLRPELQELQLRSRGREEAPRRGRGAKDLKLVFELPQYGTGETRRDMDPARPQEGRHRRRTAQVRMGHLSRQMGRRNVA